MARELSGKIKEDEKEAFLLLCEKLGVDSDSIKNPGNLNKLLTLCEKESLIITLDYHNSIFKVIYPVIEQGMVEKEKVEEPLPEPLAGFEEDENIDEVLGF